MQIIKFASAFSLTVLLSVACSDKPQKSVTVANITTNYGDIEFVLLDETPLHKQNFLKICADSFYNEVLFHRVIKNFVIQAGETNTRGIADGEPFVEADSEYTVPQEILPQFHHVRGAVSAARMGDNVNPQRASSHSHFYVVHGKNLSGMDDYLSMQSDELPEDIKESYSKDGGAPNLDGAYTVFGYIVDGMDVVDKIAEVETMAGDRPVKNVIIEKVDITVEDDSKYRSKEIYKLFNN